MYSALYTSHHKRKGFKMHTFGPADEIRKAKKNLDEITTLLLQQAARSMANSRKEIARKLRDPENYMEIKYIKKLRLHWSETNTVPGAVVINSRLRAIWLRKNPLRDPWDP